MRTVARALALVALAATISPGPARAALAAAQRTALQHYISALVSGHYDAAFAMLSPDERRYFQSPANFASIFAADRFKIDSFVIVGSKSDKLGTVALVSERVEFFDHARQTPGRVTAKVLYGILRGPSGYVIKDPLHPWRALAPPGVTGMANGLRVSVRKLSFYTGRLEIVATFANFGDTAVTVLPYGRTVLRDQSGKTFPLIASRLGTLTDKTLYTGLRLAGSSQYTGFLTFLTPDRFLPKTLSLTIAPALTDGADAPFGISLPTFTLGT
jgi:hypothetical protein